MWEVLLAAAQKTKCKGYCEGICQVGCSSWPPGGGIQANLVWYIEGWGTSRHFVDLPVSIQELALEGKFLIVSARQRPTTVFFQQFRKDFIQNYFL